MLGRTAGGLFWMFRYLERAENISRLIDAGLRISLTRSGDNQGDWNSILKTAAVLEKFDETYSSEINLTSATDWLLRDKTNPSSVLVSIESARSNARIVRTALTREAWEAINEAWMLISQALSRKVSERDLPAILHLIRERVAYVRGSLHGTMLRNEIFNFARIGTFLERADSTARILDVKYYVLLPSASFIGSSLDNVQWSTILRSVSGEGGFQMSYGQRPKPREIAQFLILDNRMPRSLTFCANKIVSNLQYLQKDSAKAPPSSAMANRLLLFEKNIDQIFDEGLHEYIQNFLLQNAELARQVEVDYRFYR